MHKLDMILMVFAEKNFSHRSYPLRNQSGFFEFLYSQNHSYVTLGFKTLLDVIVYDDKSNLFLPYVVKLY